MNPPYVLLPEASVSTTLAVRVESPQRVLATVRITNHTREPLWLYKPLLCVDGYSEEVFYVLTPDKFNLEYRGQRQETYLGGQPGPLPVVLPREDPALYVPLPAGATHTAVTNLSEQFDFAHNPGRYLASYVAYLPVLRNQRHAYEVDTATASANSEPVPVYCVAESNADKRGDDHYVPFEVQ